MQLPSDTTLDGIHCEAAAEVDDLVVETSRGNIYVQAKRSLSLSAAPDKEFYSAVSQFTRQYLLDAAAGSRTAAGAAHSRYVLAVSDTAPNTIRVHLRDVLEEARLADPRAPLGEMRVSQEMRSALAVIKACVQAAWRSVQNCQDEPTESSCREVLKLIYIKEFRLSEGEADESRAKETLREVILHDPAQAGSAWSVLLKHCYDLIVAQGSADRRHLQELLQQNTFRLRALRSYRSDIDSLKRLTERTMEELEEYAQLNVGGIRVKLPRQLTLALRRAAEQSSVLVVGEPGVGKSGALYDLVSQLAQEGRDVVFLSAERAQELGVLEHDVVEVLRNWPGSEPAFLVVDALDAARGSDNATRLKGALKRLLRGGSRWRVVAAIRRFDLRYDTEWQRLFDGPLKDVEDDYQFDEFSRYSHFRIPELTNDELTALPGVNPTLARLLAGAPQTFLTLVANLFNLRLACELVADGLAAEVLQPLRTQIELLDRYWTERVLGNEGLGDDRERLLTRACEAMRAARKLLTSRGEVYEAGLSNALDQLLRSGVLREREQETGSTVDRTTLAFAHHRLFDYAVERLLLRPNPAQVAQSLAQEPDLVLFLRPSLAMCLERLWFESRGEFWAFAYSLLRPDLRRIVQLIPMYTVARLAIGVADLGPLNEHLDEEGPGGEGARQHLRYLVNALNSTGVSPDPWCAELVILSERLQWLLVPAFRLLFSRLTEDAHTFSESQKRDLNLAACRLLDFVWQDPTSGDRWLSGGAIRALYTTYDARPRESEAYLLRALAPDHLINFGYMELSALAEGGEQLFRVNPDLALQMYRAAFSHEEVSEDRTSFGSAVLPLSSSRRQDYALGMYKLSEVYPTFLELAPEQAVLALVVVLESYVSRRSHYGIQPGGGVEKVHRPVEALPTATFRYGDVEAFLATDHSSIWDTGFEHRVDDHEKMLDAFSSFLGKAAERSDAPLLEQAVSLLVRHNRLAVIWRRLLRLGVDHPETAICLKPLMFAKAFYESYDTQYLMGELLKVAYLKLEDAEKLEVEGVIHSIYEDAGEGQRLAQRLVQGLLNALPEVPLSDKVRKVLKGWNEQEREELQDPGNLIEVSSQEVTEELDLAEAGVPIDAEPNRRTRLLEQPLEAFVGAHKDEAPTTEAVAEILPSIEKLYRTVSAGDTGVHEKQLEYALGHLAEACTTVAGSPYASCSADSLDLVKNILLDVSRSEHPVFDARMAEQFNRSPVWGIPAPRLQAARGLVYLSRFEACADGELIRRVEALSRDSVPSVRFQVASNLHLLRHTANEAMWRTVERLGHEEQNFGVLQGLLTTLGRLVQRHQDRVVPLVEALYGRAQGREEAEDLRERCLGYFSHLFLHNGHPVAEHIVSTIVQSPASDPEGAKVIAGFRRELTLGLEDNPRPEDVATRARAFYVFRSLVRAVNDEIGLYDLNQADKLSQSELDTVRGLISTADHVAVQIYFASGAYNGDTAFRLDDRSKRHFWAESKSLIVDLSKVVSARDAHYLMQMLEHYLPLEPRDVLLTAAAVIKSSQANQYVADQMGAEVVVRMAERYLAEFNELILSEPVLQTALLDLLDAFIGFPQVLELSLKLEDVYR